MIDHRLSRQVARHVFNELWRALERANEQWLPWEWNSRKGYYEGQFIDQFFWLQRNGFSRAEAQEILRDQLEWIMNDVMARRVPNDQLDMYPTCEE